MSEEQINLKKKYSRVLFLIIFGIIFYLFISNKQNFEWVYRAIKPLLSAFIIAYLLEPSVKFFTKKFKIRRGLSVFIVFVLLFILVVFIISVVVPSLAQNARDLIKQLPTLEQFNQLMQNIMGRFENENMVPIINYINESLGSILSQFSEIVAGVLKGFIGKIFTITSGVLSIIISLVIAIYMLLDKEDLIARLKRFIYAYRKKEDADYLIDVVGKSNEIFSNFFIGKIIDSIIIGILCFIILIIAKIPYASIIALVVGVTNMIPYFGPFIGGVPAVIITLFVSPIKALWVSIIILALQQFDGLYLGPKILGDKVGVRAFWIITSVTVGGVVAGVWGMFLGVPAVVLVKSLVEQSVENRLKKKNMENFEIEKLK